MEWQTVRQKYPNQWLVIEATAARNQGERRILTDIAVLNTCSTFQEATHYCSDLHSERPSAELYCVNTDWETLNIGLPVKISPMPRKYATRIKRRTPMAE